MSNDSQSASKPPESGFDKAGIPGAGETGLFSVSDTSRGGGAGPTDARASSWVGRRLGRYEIKSLVGSGAMGTVYLAHDTLIERDIAIKALPTTASSPMLRDRFFAEARAVGKINHPHVVQIYEVGESEGTPYLVLEYVEGGSIERRMSEAAPLSVLQATQAVADAASGMAAAHAAGLLHRDLKPANLLVAADGKVKITDFGLAKFTSTAQAGVTQAGQVMGTPYFMSPEQCESRLLDNRSDIYSLGATYYALLTGKNPYAESDSIINVLYEHCHGAPLDPCQVRHDVPDACAKIIERATAKRPEDRYQSMEQMRADLQAIIGSLSGTGILLPSQSGVWQRVVSTSGIGSGSAIDARATASPAATSRRWLIWTTAALVLAIVGSAAVMLSGVGSWRDPSGSEPPATSPKSVTRAVAAPAGQPIKIGVLHSLTGTMAQSEAPVVDAILLAVEQINSAGGVLGRPISPIVRDGQSEPDIFAQEAERLITEDEVCTIFGCWTSASRRTVIPVIERHQQLLVYSVQYEGLEDSSNVIYTGATPNQQIIPAVRWAFAFDGRRKFYLVGSDYVFPRAANAIIRDIVGELGGEIVGESYRPLGAIDFAAVIDDIVKSKPDAILNTINGDSNNVFFRELRQAGVTPEQIPTISFSIGEAELRNLNVKQMSGDLAAWNYFQSVESAENRRFLERFHAKFGPQRVVNDPMESAYAAVHLWAQAVEACQSTEPQGIRAAAAKQKLTAPEGPVRIDPVNYHTEKTPRIGRIQGDGQFEIIWTDVKPQSPQPYPAKRSKAEWDDFLSQLYRGWGNRWNAPEK